ncbi:MAG: ActS/PrrB/RegB family redox-sensitive histidine kinase [Pseudomonadota bacterium]
MTEAQTTLSPADTGGDLPSPAYFGPSTQRVRVETLVRLRWLAITGQLFAVIGVYFGLGYSLPLMACLGVICLAAGLNLYLWWSYPRAARISDRRAALVLGFDLVQLASLLYLTGGLANPFSVLLLAPVLISATILRLPTTVALGLFVSVLISALAMWHMPLPWGDEALPVFPLVYRMGVWAALLTAIGFICTYAWRVAYESRKLANALVAAELALEREQHLSDLDGMAAAAAHELGTPLGTITVVAKEMSRAVEAGSPLADDVALILDQAERCRAILGKLSSLGTAPDEMIATKTLDAVLDDLIEPHRMFAVPISVRTEGEGELPVIRANPALSYGLGNLIENALDFAAEQVRVSANWDANELSIRIDDDGPGFSNDVLARLGEPYVSKRPSSDGSREGNGGAVGGGLGLGFFIAQTLLERGGASVSVSNRAPDLGGASVRVTFPRAALERQPRFA